MGKLFLCHTLWYGYLLLIAKDHTEAMEKLREGLDPGSYQTMITNPYFVCEEATVDSIAKAVATFVGNLVTLEEI